MPLPSGWCQSQILVQLLVTVAITAVFRRCTRLRTGKCQTSTGYGPTLLVQRQDRACLASNSIVYTVSSSFKISSSSFKLQGLYYLPRVEVGYIIITQSPGKSHKSRPNSSYCRLSFESAMATTVVTVDGEMIESLRKALNDCADRGLQHASKWY